MDWLREVPFSSTDKNLFTPYLWKCQGSGEKHARSLFISKFKILYYVFLDIPLIFLSLFNMRGESLKYGEFLFQL